MAVHFHSSQQGPDLATQAARTSPDSPSPTLETLRGQHKAEIEQIVQSHLSAGIVDSETLTQMQSQLAPLLFNQELGELLPTQQSQLKSLLADVLDGQADGVETIANASDIVARLSPTASAEFQPVAFELPVRPAENGATLQAREMNLSEALGHLLKSDNPQQLERGQQLLDRQLERFQTGDESLSAAQQMELVSLSLAHGTPAQKESLKSTFASLSTSVMPDLIREADPNTESGAALLALAFTRQDAWCSECEKALKEALSQVEGKDSLISFYNRFSAAAQDLNLPSAHRREAGQPVGVTRALADMHFAQLPAQDMFDVLMKVKDQQGSTLRPLLRSLDSQPAKKEAIRALAQQVLDKYRPASSAAEFVHHQNGTVSFNGTVFQVDRSTAGSTQAEYERARLILEILNEPGDDLDMAPSGPQLAESPTVQETPAAEPVSEEPIETPENPEVEIESEAYTRYDEDLQAAQVTQVPLADFENHGKAAAREQLEAAIAPFDNYYFEINGQNRLSQDLDAILSEQPPQRRGFNYRPADNAQVYRHLDDLKGKLTQHQDQLQAAYAFEALLSAQSEKYTEALGQLTTLSTHKLSPEQEAEVQALQTTYTAQLASLTAQRETLGAAIGQISASSPPRVAIQGGSNYGTDAATFNQDLSAHLQGQSEALAQALAAVRSEFAATGSSS